MNKVNITENGQSFSAYHNILEGPEDTGDRLRSTEAGTIGINFDMSSFYPVPDTRFQQTFQRALAREADRQRTLEWKKMGVVDPLVINQLQKGQPARVSTYVVCKVIARDVILMPFVQGILWTSLLIMLKPWLRGVVIHGRKMGTFIYNRVLGIDLVKKKRV